MGLPHRQPDHCYTVAEYLAWKGEDRLELIDGELWSMAPSPSTEHQRVSSSLHFALVRALKEARRGRGEGPCEVFAAPMDVILDEHTVVQPDLLVVCDPAKVRERIHGAPDLVVEILSPATARRDHWVKKHLYERFRVPEYLIVDVGTRFAEHLVLEGDRYGEARIVEEGEPLALMGLPLAGTLGELLDGRP